jgi:hypothetical protein
MTTIYLTHPVHGTKVANMEAEVEADVANGWNVYNPKEQLAKSKNSFAENVVEIKAEQPVEVKRRRTV